VVVDLVTWRLEQAEKERGAWALASAMTQGASIREIAAAAYRTSVPLSVIVACDRNR
jgi:hypothetical protein